MMNTRTDVLGLPDRIPKSVLHHQYVLTMVNISAFENSNNVEKGVTNRGKIHFFDFIQWRRKLGYLKFC